jgi:hypothetical protein
MRPKVLHIVSTVFFMADESRTDPGKTTLVPPAPVISSCTAFNSFVLRAVSATVAPAAA